MIYFYLAGAGFWFIVSVTELLQSKRPGLIPAAIFVTIFWPIVTVAMIILQLHKRFTKT